MNSSALLGLASALFGGGSVSLITFLAGRDKTRAETHKLKAETARIEAETATLVRANSPAGRQASPILGWFLAGSKPADYSIALDRRVFHSGEASAVLEAQLGARGFGTLMQSVSAASMRGKRIRMSAFITTADAEYAALWMRVDGPDNVTLSFDYMRDRPIKGTRPWCEYEVVLDVGKDSVEVAFGVILAARGRVWVDDFKFDEVTDDVSTTDLQGGVPMPQQPLNLDFSEE